MKKDLEEFIEEILQTASDNKLSYSDIVYITETIKMRASHRSIIIEKQ